MNIVEHDWDWARPLTRRVGLPAYVDWHHAAVKSLTPAALHRIHLNLGWCGFGYNLYIGKDGRIHRGRPLAYCGGGALNHWSDVGVCLEGNYDVEEKMPAAQLRSAQEVHDYLARKYPGIKHRRHRDVPDNKTACPGRHFPYAAIMAGLPKVKPIKLTDKSITLPRKYKPRPGWWNIQFRAWIGRVRAQGDGDRIKTAGDPLIIPVPVVRPAFWKKLMEWKKRQRAAELAAVKPSTPPRKRSPYFWRYKK